MTVGRMDFDHTTHAVSKPVAVRLKEDEQGEAEVLELESGDGGKTLALLKPGALGEAGALMERD